jgi:diguanylate cyclase (GGDEF)-like protein
MPFPITAYPAIRSVVAVVCMMATLSGPALALEPVVVQLRWFHQFQFAGYYAALHQGYYKAAGLDVVLQQGKPQVDPVSEVLSGRADFGIGVSSLIIDYLKGKPVLLLGPVFQHSPNVLIVHGRDKRPVDLANGGKIALMEGDQDVELKAMFVDEGIPFEKLKFVPDERHLEDFLERRVEALNAYISNEPFVLNRKVIDYTVLRPQTYGMDFYGDVLFTRRALAATKPELVAAFRAATLRGWQYALDHPDEIIDLIQASYNTQRKSREHLAYEARILRGLINHDVIELGHNNPGRWRHIANAYQRFGLVNADQPLDDFFYQPESKRDLGWFYKVLAMALGALIVVGGVAFYIHHINRQLKRLLAEKQEDEIRIREIAFFDALTHLPNRRLLQDRLGRVFANFRRDGGYGALMFLDLDNFKPLNDTHGHETGDQLLIEVAQRLGRCIRDTDTAARFGGDEFVVLLGELDGDLDVASEQAGRVAAKILDTLAQPYVLNCAGGAIKVEHSCSASIGVALIDGTSDEEDALRRADTAMYRAKQGGRNRISVDIGESVAPPGTYISHRRLPHES